ncbi:pyruvate phosphate dikinase [Knoellia flava TL1]|uniref:Pyruvate, phosphate dikinase n=2 Tax=Knoellia flava TaxID=913969 RepID=A0A8H9FNX0_9MICO|nr:pyruvate, phosphate dikinase [Knoellia flava]KGN30472.1 pyruvate phosphate dikinase [Knoellia flava TL1]GGB65236.1 pyruvate, phosphate dikinase [Knoellia flava]
MAHDAPLLMSFAEGDRSMAGLLGGKGANLAEMTRMGLPVPAGFTITTEACRDYLSHGRIPTALPDLVTGALTRLERESGRRLGDAADPLLVSVRSGARFSMPGMMETVLDVGLTDASLPGLVARGGERFAWDCYRRLVLMYGRTVLGIDPASFEKAAEAVTGPAGRDESLLDVADLKALVTEFRQVLRERTGDDLPQDPREQLDRSIEAVFASWNSPRANVYRAHEGIAADLGTAVNVMEMVYGNTGPRSGSGVCFTRDPATGEARPYGDYLRNAQGEDVVNGSRATVSLADLSDLEPTAYAELLGHLDTLEHHYRDLCDVEFTVENGRLWVLQTRVGKRSPAAAFVLAHEMAEEGLISRDEALLRVNGLQLESLMHPQFAQTSESRLLAEGLPASPGAAVGEAVFEPADAVRLAAAGTAVVLVRTETSAEDVDGILASAAVVTARGGLASHAAVVARGFGRTCVTGVMSLTVDSAARTARTSDGATIQEGDLLSVDGTSGKVFAGALAVRPSEVAGALESDDPAEDTEQPVVRAVRSLLGHADARRRLAVLANADVPADALRARRLGAQGIGLCRTEHTLLGERRVLVERFVLDDDRVSALAEMERLATEDFTGLLRAMDSLPVVIRLLDPPLHEFLPGVEALATEVARVEALDGEADSSLTRRLRVVRSWQQVNPMLGLRGVRLLAVFPELVDVHVRALVNAADALVREGLHPRPEIMVPLVADAAELRAARTRVEQCIARTRGTRASSLHIPVGVMIELPRAALTAAALAEHADFFSFGTNDLTQTTWGVSRDDGQTGFLTAYLTSGVLAHDPFVRLDETGVGELVEVAVGRGRSARPDLGLGVCGEHAGDPSSISFFDRVGLDYVSCSAPRVPIARLEAGRAAVSATDVVGSDTR